MEKYKWWKWKEGKTDYTYIRNVRELELSSTEQSQEAITTQDVFATIKEMRIELFGE